MLTLTGKNVDIGSIERALTYSIRVVITVPLKKGFIENVNNQQ